MKQVMMLAFMGCLSVVNAQTKLQHNSVDEDASSAVHSANETLRLQKEAAASTSYEAYEFLRQKNVSTASAEQLLKMISENPRLIHYLANDQAVLRRAGLSKSDIRRIQSKLNK